MNKKFVRYKCVRNLRNFRHQSQSTAELTSMAASVTWNWQQCTTSPYRLDSAAVSLCTVYSYYTLHTALTLSKRSSRRRCKY